MTEELLEFGTVFLIGFTFRLRDFSRFARFNTITEEDVEQALEIEVALDDNMNPTMLRPNQDEEYKPSLQLAVLPEHKNEQTMDNIPVVLIENPGKSADGRVGHAYFLAVEPTYSNNSNL